LTHLPVPLPSETFVTFVISVPLSSDGLAHVFVMAFSCFVALYQIVWNICVVSVSFHDFELVGFVLHLVLCIVHCVLCIVYCLEYCVLCTVYCVLCTVASCFLTSSSKRLMMRKCDLSLEGRIYGVIGKRGGFGLD
jgi:hypothetical protein